MRGIFCSLYWTCDQYKHGLTMPKTHRQKVHFLYVYFFSRENPDPAVKWNEKTDVNRKSYQGDYEIVDNVPR